MTSGNLIERALRRLGPVLPVKGRTAARTTLAVLIPDAARRVVASALERGDRLRLESLRRTYTVSASAGEADISTLLSAANGLYPDALGMAEVRDSTGRRFEWEPDRQAVALMAREGFPVVAREGSKLIFGDADGNTGTLTGTVTVVAYGVPYAGGVVTIPEALEPALIDALVDLAQGARAEEQAA